MKKQNIMPVLVLTLICLAVAALLGGVNMLTKDKIAENALKKEQESLIEVMPGATLFDEVDIPEGAPATVKTVYREKGGLGYVIITVAEKTDYSSGDMTLSVGISDGKIVGCKITSYNESKDIGKNTYPSKFVGKGEEDYDEVEIVSGVTYSSRAFKAAIGDSLATEKLLSKQETAFLSETSKTRAAAQVSEKTASEIKTLLEELVSGKTFAETALPTGASETLKNLYTVSDGGYAAHIVVKGQYVPVATEGVVYVDASGEVKAVKLLQWVVGHGVGSENFEQGFLGKDIYSSCEVDIVSGATVTSYDFKKAVVSAINLITDLQNAKETVFAKHISAVCGGAKYEKKEIPQGAPSEMRGLYSVDKGGYVIHIVVPGAYVPVATEALVYVNSRGDVEDIEFLQWIVGHDVDIGNFGDGFIGVDIYHFDEIELVSGATGTSSDFKNAATKSIAAVTDLMNIREQVFLDLVDELIPNSGKIEKLELPKDAPETLKGLYTDTRGRGTVAHIVVAGEYVPVATEALVYFDNFGTIKGVNLMQWVVGHGVEPGDFADRFVGKNIDTVTDVELVSAATYTAQDFRNAVAAVCPVIPVKFPIFKVLAGAALLICVGAFVSYLIISRRRRMGR